MFFFVPMSDLGKSSGQGQHDPGIVTAGRTRHRFAATLCAQRAHPFEKAGQTDRGVDRTVRVHQPGAGVRRRGDHRWARKGRGGEAAWSTQGSDARAVTSERGRTTGLCARRQQARAQCRLGQGDAGDRTAGLDRPRVRRRADRVQPGRSGSRPRRGRRRRSRWLRCARGSCSRDGGKACKLDG